MIEAIFSRYRIIKQLGSGGMGEVYLAQDPGLNRRVALKVLSAAHTNDAERVRGCQQEAATASALNHPNIVTIHEAGEAATNDDFESSRPFRPARGWPP